MFKTLTLRFVLLSALLLTGIGLAQPDPATVYAWFKADSGPITNASGTVTNWQNSATMGTPANRNLNQYSGTPTLVAGAGPNVTGPAVRFLGAGGAIHYLRGTGANFGSLSNARTVVVYCKLLGIPGGGGFLFDGATVPGLSRAQTDNSSWQMGVASSGRNYDADTLPFQTNVWQIHTFTFNRTNGVTDLTHAIFGGASFSLTDSTTNALSGLILGQPNAPLGGYGLSVDFAELLVYDRLLTGTEQTDLFTYLTNKWAPPVPSLQSGAYAWFKADTGALTNSTGNVTNWQNQAVTGTPSARNLNTTGNAPSFIPAAAGTNPVVRFDGTQNIFAGVGNFGALTANRTVVACLKLSGTNGGFLFDGSTSTGMNRAQIRDGSWQVGIQSSPIGNGGNADPATFSILPDVWQTHVFNFEPVAGGTRITHSLFNGASVTYTNASTDGLGGLILGENVSQNLGLAADLGEFFVYDRSLTTNELQTLGAYLANKWQVATLPPPALLDVSPTNVTALGGAPVTLTGTNFAPGLTVKFGGVNAASVNYINATTAMAVTPGRTPGLVHIEVRNADNQFSVLSNAFTFDPAPAPIVSGIAPTNGTTLGGTSVTIAGGNFSSSAAVTFGGINAASLTFNSATQITAVTPGLIAGAHDVRVTNPDSQFAMLSGAFTAVAPPSPPPAAASVYAWFKGDVGIPAWSAVTGWANQATSGANPAARNLNQISGTPTGLPVVTPGGEKNVVRCDGADAVWGTSANFGVITTNRAVVAFCRLTSTNGGFLFDGSTASGMTRAQVRNGSWQAGLQPSGGGSNADTNTLQATPDVWQTHIFSFERLASSTRVTHTIAGGGSFTYTNSQTVGLGGLIVGRNVAATLGLAVDVAEFLVFDRTLDSTEQSNLVNYLAAKWGTPTDATPPDMVVLSCTAAQENRTVPNFGLHHVLDARIVTTGAGSPVALTNLTFTLAGSTDAAADVAAVKVFFTGTGDVFQPLTLFATYNGPMTGTISLAGSQELQSGTNHFWIAVEPKRATPWGRLLDAALVSFGVSDTNGTLLPAISAPPEFLTVGNAPSYSVLRKRGDDGSFEFRIPGLAVTTNGTLIAAFDIRWDAINDLPANIDVGCMRSTDLGNTWGPMITVLDFDQNVPGSSGNGVGDAAVLVDRQTGTIWVAALWSYGNRSIAGSQTGTATNRTGQYVLSRSDDDGLTWSAPLNITVEAKANTNWGCTFVGPGKGIQLRNGTLVFPSQHTQPGGSAGRVFFIYSTDHGASWSVSPDAPTANSATMNENQMVELNSGQIMASMRMSSGGGGYRGWSTYTPGSSLSNGTWSPLLLNLPDPICQGSFIRYSSTLDGAPRDRLLFSNPSNSVPIGYASRIRQTIYMSEDEGQTWSVARQIDALAGYSDMAVLPDGTVGIFYEAPADYDMVFRRFSLDWLTQADVDSDDDGMSDYYEGINGLINGVNDAALDKDGDGKSNLEEFRSGTMANDAQSIIKITAVQQTNATLTVTWNSVPLRHYAVEASNTFSAPNWTVVPGAEELVATSGRHSFSMAVSNAPEKAIRIRALAY